MPKRPTPPSSNALLVKKNIGKNKTTSSKKGKKKEPKPAKSIENPPLPTPHESQAALITLGGQMLNATPSLIVTGETGDGKTIMLGHIMRNEAEKMVRPPLSPCQPTQRLRPTPCESPQIEASKKDGEVCKVLNIGAFQSTEMAIEHAAAIGADENVSPFTMEAPKMKLLRETINAYGYGTISVTFAYLRDHIIVGTKGAKKPIMAQLLALAGKLGVTVIQIGLDEAHTVYNKAKFPDAIHAWRLNPDFALDLYILPCTATPNLGRQNCRINLIKLCGMDTVPPTLAYTPEQAAQFRLDNQVTPLAPATATTSIELGVPPSHDAGIMVKQEKVRSCVVNLLSNKDRPTIYDEADEEADQTTDNHGYNRLQLSNAVTSIAVKQAIGSDGGKLLDAVTTGGMMVKRLDENKKPSGEPFELKFEAVIIGAKTREAEDEILCILQALAAKTKGTDNEIKVHDLRYKYHTSLQTKRKQRKEFKKDFNAQTGTVFGIIGPKQHTSVNNLHNIGLTFAFFGEASETYLKQFFGRSSRPGTSLLKEGDFVPAISYKTIHLYSDWGGNIMRIESPSEKITRSTPALSDAISAEYNTLKQMMTAVGKQYECDEIKLNIQKLILGDRFIRSNNQIVFDYIEAERAKYMPKEEEAAAALTENEDEDEDEDEGEDMDDGEESEDEGEGEGSD